MLVSFILQTINVLPRGQSSTLTVKIPVLTDRITRTIKNSLNDKSWSWEHLALDPPKQPNINNQPIWASGLYSLKGLNCWSCLFFTQLAAAYFVDKSQLRITLNRNDINGNNNNNNDREWHHIQETYHRLASLVHTFLISLTCAYIFYVLGFEVFKDAPI